MGDGIRWPTVAELAPATGVVARHREGRDVLTFHTDTDGIHSVTEAGPHGSRVLYRGTDDRDALSTYFQARGRWQVASETGSEPGKPSAIIQAWIGAHE